MYAKSCRCIANEVARGKGHQGEKDALFLCRILVLQYTYCKQSTAVVSLQVCKKSITGYLIILSLLRAFFLWTESRSTVFMCVCIVLVIISNSQHLRKEANKSMNGCMNANQQACSVLHQVSGINDREKQDFLKRM